MRLAKLFPFAVASLWAAHGFAAPLGNESPSAESNPSNKSVDAPKDLLGNMVVVASSARALPKIGVLPSISPEIEDVTLRSVVRRDLDLSGEFELLDESAAPDGLYLPDSKVDVAAWKNKGAEAVVRVTARKTNNVVELIGEAYLASTGDVAVLEKTFTVPAGDVRKGSHRMADALIGALTGHQGAFASRLTFASGSGKVRRVYVIDADGFGAKAVSPENEVAIFPAFGKDQEVVYASSAQNGDYHLRTEGGKTQVVSLKGSAYGIAYNKDKSKVAVSIGVGGSIGLYTGPDLNHLQSATPVPFAMEPTFTPTGTLAFVGLSGATQRVYVNDKPVTPEGVFAMSPTFCNHPDGVRLVIAAGASLSTDLFSTGETGGALVRLTQDQGINSSPACSPDGRLIAFFSTRKTGEGPGLYVMRLDAMRPKRISPLMGDSLRWEMAPQGVSP
ncbi:MAG: PD40 domain-containing protein [Polyangiaceae bacterium]|nr:PD40 domain-containing protein [Polyangiaceae bacterium]